MFRVLAALSLAALLVAQANAQQTQPAPAAAGSKAGRQAQTKAGAIVNLNTATAAELEELPGVGPRTAARIVEYRQKKGLFKKPEELMNVQGIGEKSFLKLKSQITVTSKADAPAAQQN